MAKYPALFKIEYYDDGGKNHVIHGLIYANSFADAAKTLETTYGFSEIEKMEIELFEEGIIELPEDIDVLNKVHKKLLGVN